MAEPLKNMYTRVFFEGFAEKVIQVYPAFDTAQFLTLIYDEGWNDRELKQRFRHIAQCLGQTLPAVYEDALDVLLKLSEQCRGFEYLFFPDFVEVYGLEELPLSILAMEAFTKSSSAEFAVRPFIIKYPDAMMAQMVRWAEHSDPHLRRLASEGCRPRLPWSFALESFKKDPTPIMPILLALKSDESEYVRKSVANNINDISKDHPQLVLQIAKDWYGKHPQTNWILKHGCRGLLKQGNPEALALFGFENLLDVSVRSLTLSSKTVALGDAISFSFILTNNAPVSQKIRMEYGIDFMKSNGRGSRKLFKLSEKAYVSGGIYHMRKRHQLKDLTTRKHYGGEHRLTILINGVEAASETFHLSC
jgi:3-methyladenine DNA glycosylase AlkC